MPVSESAPAGGGGGGGGVGSGAADLVSDMRAESVSRALAAGTAHTRRKDRRPSTRLASPVQGFDDRGPEGRQSQHRRAQGARRPSLGMRLAEILGSAGG